jgi:nucleoside-triphosphatase THEP1
MNNLFIEGPIQMGKSTVIRKVLKEMFGPKLDGVAGFTSQRLTERDGQLLGFRLAPANEDISIIADPTEMDHVFKWFAPDGPHVDMRVFETTGVAYIKNALTQFESGRACIILLDEIGGHELACDTFRKALYELLDSDAPCIGVVKSPENTKRMDPTLIHLNENLHRRLSVITDLEAFELHLRDFIPTVI